MPQVTPFRSMLGSGEIFPAYSYLHDGTNTTKYFMQITDVADLELPTDTSSEYWNRQSFSFQTWFKSPGYSHTMYLYHFNRTGGATSYATIGSSGAIQFVAGFRGWRITSGVISDAGSAYYGANGGSASVTVNSTSLHDGNWHFIKFIADLTQGTESNRARLWIDGSLQVPDSSNYPSISTVPPVEGVSLTAAWFGDSGFDNATILSEDAGGATKYNCDGYFYDMRFKTGSTLFSRPLGPLETAITGDSELTAAWTDGGATHITASSTKPTAGQIATYAADYIK